MEKENSCSKPPTSHHLMQETINWASRQCPVVAQKEYPGRPRRRARPRGRWFWGRTGSGCEKATNIGVQWLSYVKLSFPFTLGLFATHFTTFQTWICWRNPKKSRIIPYRFPSRSGFLVGKMGAKSPSEIPGTCSHFFQLMRPNTQNDQLCGMPKWRHEHSWCYGNGSNFDTKKWMVKQIENHHRRVYGGSRFLRRSQLPLIPSHKVPAWGSCPLADPLTWQWKQHSWFHILICKRWVELWQMAPILQLEAGADQVEVAKFPGLPATVG